MPKAPLSFGDGLQKIVGDLAQMELDPSADRNLINQIRETIISFQASVGQQLPPQQAPDSGPGAVPGTLELPGPIPSPDSMGLPLPVPVTEGELSRGPRPNPDTSGMVEELSRVMQGS